MSIQDQLARVERGLVMQEHHLADLERRVATLYVEGVMHVRAQEELINALRIYQANANALAETLHQAREELAR